MSEQKEMDDLMKESDTGEVPIRVFAGENLGNRTLSVQLPMYDFFNRSVVANERETDEHAQRRLDPTHARKLAIYILRGLVWGVIRKYEIDGRPVPEEYRNVAARLGEQPYFALQPMVANLRTCGRDGRATDERPALRGRAREAKDNGEILCFEFLFGQKDLLWIVDGQHRRWAMELLFQFLKEVRLYRKYPKKSLYAAVGDIGDIEMDLWADCAQASRQYMVKTELHLGLNVEEERQMFHDLNNLGKKVEAGLSFEFDQSNPVNMFIKDELIDRVIKVVEKDVVNWRDDTGAIARKDLVAVNAHLFLNKSNVSGAMPPTVNEKKDYALQFWTVIAAISGFGEEGAKETTVAAQPVVLKAIAKLAYDFKWGKHTDAALFEKLMDGITDVDFGHDNPMWRYYEMDEKLRKQHGLLGLAKYLPQTEGNRDIGKFQNGVFRFGAKHNDIFPIIGDMIRWSLGLPSRHSQSELVEV